MKIVIRSIVSKGEKNISRRGTMFAIGVVTGLADTAEEEIDTHKIFPAVRETIRELGYMVNTDNQMNTRNHDDIRKLRHKDDEPHKKHTVLESSLIARCAALEHMAKTYKEMYLSLKHKHYAGIEVCHA